MSPDESSSPPSSLLPVTPQPRLNHSPSDETWKPYRTRTCSKHWSLRRRSQAGGHAFPRQTCFNLRILDTALTTSLCEKHELSGTSLIPVLSNFIHPSLMRMEKRVGRQHKACRQAARKMQTDKGEHPKNRFFSITCAGGWAPQLRGSRRWSANLGRTKAPTMSTVVGIDVLSLRQW